MWRSNHNYPLQRGFHRGDPGSSFSPSSSGAPQGLRWSSYEERPVNPVVDDDRFLLPPYTPVPFSVFENGMPRRNLWTIVRQSIPDPPPRFIPAPYEQAESRLNREEQKNALQKLRKEIYNPSPKSIFKRVSLYYRENSRNKSNERDKVAAEDEDGKRCAVCLEDFEPREEVMVTPCNHMFHEACIVPWVTSHGQCPVCRAAVVDHHRVGERPGPGPGPGPGPVPFNVPLPAIAWFFPRELAALEETFARINRSG